jgi:hypothetical protein
MPEFTQVKQQPFSQLIVRFETAEDLAAFSKLTGQKLTEKTKSMWFPEKQNSGDGFKRWV